jgi:hydroxymethylbilane synthase
MSPTRLVLATRRSALALAQSRAFGRLLEACFPGLVVGELQVVTTGDKVQNVPLAEIGGKGLFTKEIEEALAKGDADFAVHSFKDVPAELANVFVIACVPKRVDARDVLVTKSGAKLSELPKGAKVGTSSLRRATQLLLARPDLVVAPLRGNVDTRLRKLDQGELDAIVLAKAGLERLDLASRATETIDPFLVIPAPGQGALAIECRAADRATRDVLGTLSDVETEVAVACERGVMKAVGGNCNVPFGAHAVRRIGELALLAFLADADGQHPRRVERVVPWPETTEEAERVGREAGTALLGPTPTTS